MRKLDEQTSAQQESILWQEEINFLKDRIRYQEIQVELARRRIGSLLDSPNSEQGLKLSDQLKNEIEQYNRLVEQYTNTLSIRNSVIQKSSSSRSDYTTDRMAFLFDESIQLEDAKLELNRLNEEHQNIQQEESKHRQLLQRLLKDRKSLQ